MPLHVLFPLLNEFLLLCPCENIYLVFHKFKSRLLYEVFPASRGQRGALLPAIMYLVHASVRELPFWTGGKEFPKSEDKTKNRSFPPIKERKTQRLTL